MRAKIDIKLRDLTGHDVADLVAFLSALTGTEPIKSRLGKPEHVPSGLKVDGWASLITSAKMPRNIPKEIH